MHHSQLGIPLKTIFSKVLLVSTGLALLTACSSPLSIIPGNSEKNVLTGISGTNGKVLAVKIDDTSAAHPQIGIEKADVSEIESNESFSYKIDEGSESDKLIYYIDRYIEYCTENINTLFPKKVDAQIADAILELFRKRESIDVFNKKALYIYIREIIDAKTPKITKIADRLYDIFKQHYFFYLENGYTNF